MVRKVFVGDAGAFWNYDYVRANAILIMPAQFLVSGLGQRVRIILDEQRICAGRTDDFAELPVPFLVPEFLRDRAVWILGRAGARRSLDKRGEQRISHFARQKGTARRRDQLNK